MVDLKPLTSSILFTNLLGWLLSMGGYIEFNFMNSNVFLLGTGIMMLAIGLSNTPILKGGAVLGFGLFLFAYITSVTVPNTALAGVIYGLITLPSLATLGFILLEVGKG